MPEPEVTNSHSLIKEMIEAYQMEASSESVEAVDAVEESYPRRLLTSGLAGPSGVPRPAGADAAVRESTNHHGGSSHIVRCHW